MSAMETGATAPTEAGGPNEAARDADTIEEKMAVEEKMAMLLRDGNVAGMQELLRSARMVNVRMVNMVLSAELESGCPIERAAVNMLQTCRKRKLAPSAALYNNVLGALSKRAPPEQVLHHPSPVRVSSHLFRSKHIAKHIANQRPHWLRSSYPHHRSNHLHDHLPDHLNDRWSPNPDDLP